MHYLIFNPDVIAASLTLGKISASVEYSFILDLMTLMKRVFGDEPSIDRKFLLLPLYLFCGTEKCLDTSSVALMSRIPTLAAKFHQSMDANFWPALGQYLLPSVVCS